MSSQGGNLRARILLVLAILLILAGIASLVLYGMAVFPVIDSADQSMLFWALPFLFGGLTLSGIGAVLLVFWRLLVLRNRERGSEP